jgi:hypothetical protein
MSLIDHLERYLGEIEAGWSRNADGHEMPFQVARFPKGSHSGTVSFATVGLSRHPLRSASGKDIRQELMVIVPDGLRDGGSWSHGWSRSRLGKRDMSRPTAGRNSRTAFSRVTQI